MVASHSGKQYAVCLRSAQSVVAGAEQRPVFRPFCHARRRAACADYGAWGVECKCAAMAGRCADPARGDWRLTHGIGVGPGNTRADRRFEAAASCLHSAQAKSVAGRQAVRTWDADGSGEPSHEVYSAMTGINDMPNASAGRITALRGSVIEVEFAGRLPAINEALRVVDGERT
jgi:hypothetical protein